MAFLRSGDAGAPAAKGREGRKGRAGVPEAPPCVILKVEYETEFEERRSEHVVKYSYIYIYMFFSLGGVP